MTSNLDPDARSSYRLITLAARLIQRRQDDALAPLGLTRAAVIALEGLMGGPLNQEQLADAIRVQSQTLGRVLTRLEATGLITRMRHASDRRQLKVELTDAGVAAVEAARKAEVNAYPDDPEIAWNVLREELTKFVRAVPPVRDTGVVPFAPPEHRAGHGHAHRPQAGRSGGARSWDQPRQN
ncbi:MarR family winged helix-turn-helix transcriptional regulator [Arthrobacter sp. SLBN-122]|uniref:MarR family winged helix-turn-helix transcriptional regulator n=1 Tax=Arthrobacter sp. SLBN-122 TaxID=2768455 RepID=UPI00114F863F|nr:MarR family transcriptional regulator [Arthrobacter sp. SLBN-122]TQJ34586.1 DNA-binding MarR family transcriptional regulator [Arthrobacter sp. SLBN-122]